MCNFEEVEILSHYPLSQAVEDGMLVKLCDIRWGTKIKPLVATAHLLSVVKTDQVIELWDEYVAWKQNVMPKLKEEDQMFVTKVNGEKIWIVEDDAAYTAMLPSDY